MEADSAGGLLLRGEAGEGGGVGFVEGGEAEGLSWDGFGEFPEFSGELLGNEGLSPEGEAGGGEVAEPPSLGGPELLVELLGDPACSAPAFGSSGELAVAKNMSTNKITRNARNDLRLSST